MKNKKVLILVESAVLIAVATVLSMIKIVDLPYGGSVTIAAMLPIIIISYRHGLSWGMGAGIVFAAIQQLTGLKTLSYVTTWQSILAVVMLDYIVAYAVTGLGGIFRKSIKNQAAGLAAGSVFVCVLRYICHVISGATVWAGISIPTAAAMGYSIIYNATYMLPEMLVTAIAAFYIGSLIDFREQNLTRVVSGTHKAGAGILSGIAGLLIAGGLIFDIAAVFSKLQDAESGEFAITQISAVNWPAVIGVSAGAAVLAAVLLAIANTMKKKIA